MKTLLLTSLLFFFTIPLLAQCEIDPFIKDTRYKDAQILALREILSNPNDPDYHEGFIPEERLTPYLEKLSAVYQNPNNIAFIDSLFNQFDFHANSTYAYFTPIKSLFLKIDSSVEWYSEFTQTGVSNIPALDNLMDTYQFEISPFYANNFLLKSNLETINITGILEEFEDIEGIESAYPNDEPLNEEVYTGESYMIEGEEVGITDYAELCDISLQDGVFNFTLYGGDCLSGCFLSESWEVIVSEDCQEVTLASATPKAQPAVQVYPNPASDYLVLENLPTNPMHIRIFNLHGKLINALNNYDNSPIDISNLNSGIYFLYLENDLGYHKNLRFIKK